MLHSSVYLALLLTLPADDPMQEARMERGGKVTFAVTSKMSKAPDRRTANAITDTIVNHLSDAAIAYSFGDGFTGVIGKADAKDGKVVPRMVTTVRTSSRRLVEVDGQLEGRSPDGQQDFVFSANRWGERDEQVLAADGSKLEAKWIDGDAKGRTLVRSVSEAARVPGKGLRYTYLVENPGDRPLKFKWGDIEGTVKPKQSFTKTVVSADATAEESAALAVTFDGDKEPTVIRTNRWALPK